MPPYKVRPPAGHREAAEENAPGQALSHATVSLTAFVAELRPLRGLRRRAVAS